MHVICLTAHKCTLYIYVNKHSQVTINVIIRRKVKRTRGYTVHEDDLLMPINVKSVERVYLYAII